MRVAVIGVGNVLMKDEGVGIAVVEELRRRGVEAYDCGTMGIDVVNVMLGYDKVIVVDAVRGFGRPGEVFKFELDEVGCERSPLSLHDVNLLRALKLAGRVLKLPKVVVVGIEVKEIGMGMGLSEEVRRAIPKAVDLVLEELENV